MRGEEIKLLHWNAPGMTRSSFWCVSYKNKNVEESARLIKIVVWKKAADF